jgi:hypothetical protein
MTPHPPGPGFPLQAPSTKISIQGENAFIGVTFVIYFPIGLKTRIPGHFSTGKGVFSANIRFHGNDQKRNIFN